MYIPPIHIYIYTHTLVSGTRYMPRRPRKYYRCQVNDYEREKKLSQRSLHIMYMQFVRLS